MHRLTILAHLLAVIHAVGAATDARSPWMLARLTAITDPVAFLFAYRVFPSVSPRRGPRQRAPHAESAAPAAQA